jgi:hypothetical protein
MRILSACWVALAFGLAGCCGSHECHPKSESTAATETCTEGDCCEKTSPTTAPADQTEVAAVALKTVKFDAFEKEIQANQGKIVFAYQWTNANPASRKNLPVLLALQKKYSKEGLIGLTASSDLAKNGKDALKHLEEIQCVLGNYLQDETDVSDGWTSCFGCCGFPSLVVFDRAGKKAASFEVTELPFDLATLEKAITPLLNAK